MCWFLVLSPKYNKPHFTSEPFVCYTLEMENHAAEETLVYDNRFFAWLWAIALPIGIYLLSAKLFQSFGIYLPFFSEPTYPIGWGTRLIVCVTLIVWLRGALGIISRVRGPILVVSVSDQGVKFPGAWSLKWSEIDRITNHFGTLRFYPKDSSLSPIEFFPPQASYGGWRNAKFRIKRCAPEALSRSI